MLKAVLDEGQPLSDEPEIPVDNGRLAA